ncbi:MAG: DMT family transporter [Chloroflexota bacterium]|jgi:drug/metabolite transporter (DMT)-like permease
MERKHHHQGISAALLSALLLGLLPVFGKQALLLGFTPFAVVSMRTTLAVSLLFIFMLFHRRYFYIYPVGLIGCFLAGFINGIGSIFYYVALARIEASVGHLLYSFYPLFVVFWLLLDRQPISPLTFFRLLLALPGAYLLLSAAENSIDWLGAGFMLISAAFYGLHLIINQRILYEAPPPTVTFYTLLSMAVTVSSVFLLFDRQLPVFGTPWLPLIGMGVVTFFARLTLFMGVKRLGGLQTALLGLGELIVTVALARIWLGEQLSLTQWIGALLIGASLFLVGFDRYTPEKRRQTGWLAWLNTPRIPSANLPWHK